MGKFDRDRGGGRNRNDGVRESASAANKTPLGRPTSGFGARSPGAGGAKTGGSLLKPAYLVGALQDKQGSSPASSSSSSSSFSPQKPPSSFASFSNYNTNYGSNSNNNNSKNNTPSQSQSRFGNQDYSSTGSSFSTDYYNSGSNKNNSSSSGSGSSYGNYNQNQNRYNQNRSSSSSYTSASGDNNNTSSGGSSSNYQNYPNYGGNNNNSSSSSNTTGSVAGRYSNDNYSLATIPQFPSSTSSQFSSSASAAASSFMSMSGISSSNSGSIKRDYNISMGSGNNNNNGNNYGGSSSSYSGFDNIGGTNYNTESVSSIRNTTIDDSSNVEDGASERKRKRKSRWMGEVDEKAVIPGMSTILPSGLPDDQQEIYISQLQVQEITSKLRSGDLGIPITLENRSPSPEPVYGADGKRLNTREYRTRKKLEEDRHKLVARLCELNPEYKPPSDYRKPVVKIVDRVSIPQDEYPDINFVGLLIGPRGNTLKGLEKDTGAKIIIRGKGSVKEGKVGGKAGQPLPGEDEPLHAYVTSNNPESVKKACEKIHEIIRQGVEMPESQNDLRKTQLRELALLNGTLREGEGPKCSNCGVTSHRTWNCPDKPNVTSSVVCTVCGGAGHIGKDCIMKRPGSSCPPTGTAFNYQEKIKIDEEYMSLMAELGEGKEGNNSSEQPQRILRNRPMAAGPSLFDKPLVPKAIAAPPSSSSSSSQQQQSYQSKSYGNQRQAPSPSSHQQQHHQYQQQRQNKNPQQQQHQRSAPPPPPPSSSSALSPVPNISMPPPNFAAPPPPTSPSTQGNPYYSGTYPPSFGGWGGSYSSSSVPPPPGWGTPWAPPPPPTSSKPPLPPS